MCWILVALDRQQFQLGPENTLTVGITITGSLAHRHKNFNIAIITWNVFMKVPTFKTALVFFVQVHCNFVIYEECLISCWAICFIS